MEPRAAVESLGKRLKHLRDNVLRLTTRELSARLGELGVSATNASVTRYEQGREPPVGYVIGLARLLGCTVDHVLDADAPRIRDPSVPEAAYRRIAAIVLQVEGYVGEGGEVRPSPDKPHAEPGEEAG